MRTSSPNSARTASCQMISIPWFLPRFPTILKMLDWWKGSWFITIHLITVRCQSIVSDKTSTGNGTADLAIHNPSSRRQPSTLKDASITDVEMMQTDGSSHFVFLYFTSTTVTSISNVQTHHTSFNICSNTFIKVLITHMQTVILFLNVPSRCWLHKISRSCRRKYRTRWQNCWLLARALPFQWGKCLATYGIPNH